MKEERRVKRRRLWCVLLAALILVTGVPVTTQAAAKTVKAYFHNTNGSSYSKLYKKIKYNGKLKLPEVPEVAGYTNLGWATKKNAAAPTYKEGQTIRLKKSRRFYAVRRKVTYSTAAFYYKNGKSSAALKKLRQQVVKGSYVKLPPLPEALGYEPLGWATKKGSDVVQYKPGKKVQISKTTKFYAVYKKVGTCTVTFYMPNGRLTPEYRKLKTTLTKNGSIVLPPVPETEGYVGMGWSTKMNSSSSVYKVGKKYRIKGNVKLYAVQEKSAQVTFYKNDGSTVYKKLDVSRDSYLTLPSAGNSAGYTFLGWSVAPGKTSAPQYEAGEKLWINGSRNFYAVVFDRSKEKDLTAADLLEVNHWRQYYKQLIFVGDSRTERMEMALDNLVGDASPLTYNVHFVAKSGIGLEWLEKEGAKSVRDIVKKNSSVEMPTAVVFNLGVNDIKNLPGYISTLQSLGKELKEKNCKLFFMSVNPVNSKMIEASGHTVRKEEEVREFNQAIKNGLGQNYTFIDSYSMLMKEGYGTDYSNTGVDMGKDDGLHYTSKTYKRIYKFCLDFLLKDAGRPPLV